MRSVTWIAAVFVALAVAPRAPMTAEEKRAPRELLFAEHEDPRTLDPHKAGDVVSSRHCGLVYESLLEYDPFEPGRLQPCLAVALPEFDKEAGTYTFKLREDVCFADDACFPEGKGRRVTSADVVYSFKRLAALPDSGGFWILEGKIEGLDEFAYKAQKLKGEEWRKHLENSVSGLVAQDERTLKVKLTESYPQFLLAISLSYGAVVAREACVKYGAELARHPVGTGPFVLSEWKQGDSLTYRRNQKYREVKLSGMGEESPLKRFEGARVPLSDSVHYSILKDDAAESAAFTQGKIHAAGLSREDFSKYIDQAAMKAGKRDNELLKKEFRDQGVRLQTYAEPTVHYLSFNMDDAVVGERAREKGKAIRKALALSMDRQKHVNEHLNGRGTVADQLIPPGIWGHDARNALGGQRLDAKEGRRLLAEAGFKMEENNGTFRALDAKGQQLEVTLLLRGKDTSSQESAKFYSACAAQVGVNLKCELHSFAEFIKRQIEGSGQMYDAGWVMDYPDAHNVMQLLYGPNKPPGVNSAAFEDREYDELFRQLSQFDNQSDVDRIRKAVLLKRMHEIIDEETPWIVMDFRQVFTLYREGLRRPPPDAFNSTSTKCMVFEK